MLFSRYKVAYEKKRKIMRNVASVAELRKSFFAEIDKVENREDLEELRVKYLCRHKGILMAVLRSFGGRGAAPCCAKLHHAANERYIFHHAQHEV